MLSKENDQYPTYVICIDGEPLIEDDGSITLCQEGDNDELMERFMAIVFLSDDSSRVTIRKFDLIPHVFAESLSKREFKKRARETKRVG